MYKLIESNLVLCGMSKRELAEVLGIGYNTLLMKLRGESYFTLDEALEIKAAINAKESIEELFLKSA